MIKEMYVATASSWAVVEVDGKKQLSPAILKVLAKLSSEHPAWALKSPMFYHAWLHLTPHIGTDYATWEATCKRMLETADGLLVLSPGWAQSVGVQAEIKLAEELGKQVIHYLVSEE